MKGIFIHDGCEYSVEVKGDTFLPGDVLPVQISVTCRTSPREVPPLTLELVQGDLKKVKAKASDAWKLVESYPVELHGHLAAGEGRTASLELSLSKNCPITESTKSPYILLRADEVLGHLLLKINLHPYLNGITRTLESTHQFVQKAPKWASDRVQLKFAPSSARRFSFVTELVVSVGFEGDDLDVLYKFTMKKLDAEGPLKMTKRAHEVFQRLEASRYLVDGKYLDYDYFDRMVGAALDEVATNL